MTAIVGLQSATQKAPTNSMFSSTTQSAGLNGVDRLAGSVLIVEVSRPGDVGHDTCWQQLLGFWTSITPEGQKKR